jgi:alpha,alpha-trehalase
MEVDISKFLGILGRPSEDVQHWMALSENRKQAINDLLWDDEKNLYFDWNFVTKTRRVYEFATTFIPLWAGVASPEQAKKIQANLHLFEAKGGIKTSTRITKCQWDGNYSIYSLSFLLSSFYFVWQNLLDGLHCSGLLWRVC